MSQPGLELPPGYAAVNSSLRKWLLLPSLTQRTAQNDLLDVFPLRPTH